MATSIRNPAKSSERRMRPVVVLALVLLLTASPLRICFDAAHLTLGFDTSPAFADGDGESGNGGDNGGESGNGGDSGNGGESGNGGDNGGGSGNGGDDGGNGGDDGGNGGDDHGEAGSSVGGFLGALRDHGEIASASAVGDTIEVRYADGWMERVSGGRYQLVNRHNRIVINRKARAMDVKRLRAASD